MQNGLPDATRAGGSLASQVVDRALSRRQAVYADEVRRLVEASFELIQASGELEPTVSEIVRRAGLSNQAFYRHFRSKDELLLAVLDDGIRQLSDYLRHRMETADAPLEKIRRWVAGLCEQALNPKAAAATRPFALSRTRLCELFPAEVSESETQLTAMLRRAIEEAAAAGELPHADPERDSQLLYDLAMGWVQRRLAEPQPARRSDADHLLEFALHGLRRGAGAARA